MTHYYAQTFRRLIVSKRTALLAKERPTRVLPEVDSSVRTLRRCPLPVPVNIIVSLFRSHLEVPPPSPMTSSKCRWRPPFPASPAAPPPPPTTFAVQASGGTRARRQRGLRDDHHHQPRWRDSRFPWRHGTRNSVCSRTQRSSVQRGACALVRDRARYLDKRADCSKQADGAFHHLRQRDCRARQRDRVISCTQL